VDGEVHVWRVELSSVPDELGTLLRDEERERAERILSARRRALWIRARAVLRDLLARYLWEDPDALQLASDVHGKPKLADGRGACGTQCSRQVTDDQPLSFNLSHSGALALYAFARTGAVGVDIERARRRIDAAAIAERLLGPAEAGRLRAVDSTHRQCEFLRAWVRHEAALKCLGVGLARPVADPPAFRPWVLPVDVGAGAAAAVATEHKARLRRWRWQTSDSSTTFGACATPHAESRHGKPPVAARCA
jgi:4'-phosphopantetheinyl transferase